MDTNTEKRGQLKIRVHKEYVDLLDFRPLESRIARAVQAGKNVLLDLTGAKSGVRGDVYGELFQKIQANYSSDIAALEAAQQVTLRFSSRNSPAYQSLQRGYEGLFNVEFAE